QTIEGWGSSLCWWAAQIGSWEEAKVDSILDCFLSKEGTNMNIFRYNIGGGDDPSHLGGHMVKGKGKRAEMEGFKDSPSSPFNFKADQAQRRILLKIKEKRPDAIFEAFSNSPPYWMTYSGCSGGNKDPMKDNLKPEYYQSFCDYLVEVCKYYKETYGIVFRTLEPFNESTSGYWNAFGSQEGCHFNPQTQVKIIRILDKKLKESGLSTVISVSDETNIASFLKVMKTYKQEGDLLNRIGQLNVHTYSGTNTEREKACALVGETGLRFWQSETGPNKGQGIMSNLNLIQKMFDDLSIMKPSAWLDWQLMEERNEKWCLLTCDFKTQDYYINKNYYVRMQITRFFKQGYRFVEIPNRKVLAAISPSKKEFVLAVLNNTPAEKKYSLDLTLFNGKVKIKKVYRTSETENCSLVPTPTVESGVVSYVSKPLSLQTFICEMQ
ncbi:MAG: glycoside hydrolase, partial [Massilibacteroides sp.]|nr:glycoside hydrolase [Massilibacteroides sp.]